MAAKKNNGTIDKETDDNEMMIRIRMTMPNGLIPAEKKKCQTLLNQFVKEIEQELGWQVKRDQ